MDDRIFVFGVAATGSNFTDREYETQRLLNNFQHGVNTILISPRRWGKTSLVKKVASLAQSDHLKVVYLDIFSCRSDREFYTAFASAVFRQTASRFEELIDDAKTFLSRLTPQLTFGPDPMTDFSLSLNMADEERSAEEILSLPQRIAERKGIKIVICLDEFQQIGEFRDSHTFQKRLRSIWQLQTRVSYCLFGSKRHLMNEIFESRSQPFYKFGDAVYLQKIPSEHWVSYIMKQFENSGKSISPEMAERICLTVDNHSSYVQQLAWLIWIHTTNKVTETAFDDGFKDLLAQNTPLFERQTENLTAPQFNYLIALAQGVTQGLSSQETLSKYQLGSSANVAVIKKALIRQELVDTEGGRVVLADPILGQWLLMKSNV